MGRTARWTRSTADRRGRARAIPILVAVGAVALAACGSSTGGNDDGDVNVPATDAAAVADSVVSLEHLGDLVGTPDEPVSATFGAEAGRLAFGDGATVVVPADAFAEATEVTALTVDLELGRFLDDAPASRAYVVSTVDEVALDAPVVLEVAVSPDDVTVTQLVDDAWRVVDVPAGKTVKVEIAHFSDVPTVLTDKVDALPTLTDPDPGDPEPGEFFTACTYAVYRMFADPSDNADNELAGNLAMSLCTRALVTKFTPDGPRVSVGCVGDNIGDDADFRTAIAACQEQQAAETAATSTDEPAEPTPTESAGNGGEGESAPVDIGPLAWDADMTLREGSASTPSGDQWISITRAAGSDEFTASARVATTSVSDFFEIGECTTVIEKTFSGTGTFDPDIPTRLVIPGEQFVDWQYPDCGGITENDNTKPFDLIVQITETGISGGFEGFMFEADGPPVPVGG